MQVGDKVKIIQEDAPYNSSGKSGVILDIDDDDKQTWYWVRFDKPNDDMPYESWFVKEHLETEPTDYFKRKLESNGAFIKVWDTMVNDPDEVKKLKELFGTEFEHINNHFLKIKNTK